MNEGLGLSLFVGAIFALIALYSAYLSLGTKMSFVVFQITHTVILVILLIGAIDYFATFRIWISSVLHIHGASGFDIRYIFIVSIPVECMLISFWADKPLRVPIIVLLQSYLLLTFYTFSRYLIMLILYKHISSGGEGYAVLFCILNALSSIFLICLSSAIVNRINLYIDRKSKHIDSNA